jgi:hypothetical protein
MLAALSGSHGGHRMADSGDPPRNLPPGSGYLRARLYRRPRLVVRLLLLRPLLREVTRW